jgi:cysteine synthase
MEDIVYEEDLHLNSEAITFFQKRLHRREIAANLTLENLAGVSRSELYERMEKSIGSTVMRSVQLPNGNTLYQKNETGNPTETHYDRCYIALIKALELNGDIAPGDTLLETTSGSAGVSFAWVCRKLGYRAVVFMPAFVPAPRILEVRRLAAEVHLSDNREQYLLGCSLAMMAYYKKNLRAVRASGHNIYMPNHSQDFLTPRIFAQIMDEVQADIGDDKIDYFIGGIGNGSTILGIGERLKELNPEAKVIAFEPISACPF